MKKMVTNLYAKTMNQVSAWKKEEKGSQTLEWIGIAAVIIILVGLVSTAFEGSDVGSDIYEKFTGFLGKIGGE